MIISRSEIESAVAAYRAGNKRVTRTGSINVEAIVETDALAVSEEASTLTALRDRVIAQPYYRNRLVEELQRRISEGRYHVPSEHIVEKLLGRLFVEQTAGG